MPLGTGLLQGVALASAAAPYPPELGESGFTWSGWISRLAVAGVAILTLVLALAIGTRIVLTRRSLRSRVRMAVVPTDDLDPSLKTVMRLAAQLAQVRRSIGSWIDSRASALRIQLTSDHAGRLVYLVEAPASARELVRSALAGLDGVVLRDPITVLPPTGEAPRPRHAVRTELVLAQPSVEPLARLDLDPDPLQPFAAALQPLQTAAGDRALVCLDLLPVRPGHQRRLRSRLLRQATRPTVAAMARWAGPPRGSRPSGPMPPGELAERRAHGRALDAKLKDAGPLFQLQLLVRCETADRAKGKAVMRSLLSAFDTLADRNWLRATGIPIFGLGFLGSDLPGRRRWHDRRVRTGLFWPARRSLVSAREVAGLLKPPTTRCVATNVLRAGPRLPAPPHLPAFAGQPDLIPLGRIAGEQEDRLVAVRAEDSFFSYVAGRSRYGKTELAIAQFLHLVRAGHGGMFIDPHDDAVARIKHHLTDPPVRDRVVEINLGGPGARERQPGWNLFELVAAGPGRSEIRVDAIVDAFASALSWDERNNRALTLTTQAAQALAHVAQALPAELAPTIFQLPTLLSDDDWRQACLPLLPRASQRYWRERFPRLSEEAITPVTNLIDRLRASTPTTALLGRSRSSYRVREAMDRGQIVLACPGAGSMRDRLVANLLVFDLLHAAKTRAELPPPQRRPFWVFLDEVQTYDGAASGNLAALLEQTAKYGIRAVLLNQNPERLTAATLNAVTTNRSHLLATALNARAAHLIAREWGDQPDPTALTRLSRYQFLAQVTSHGQPSGPFRLAAVPVGELHGPGRPDQLEALEQSIDSTADRHPVSETVRELDTLDERIHDHLTRSPEGSAASPPVRSGGLTIPPAGSRT